MRNPEGIPFSCLTSEQVHAVNRYCKNSCALLFPELGPCGECAQKAVQEPVVKAIRQAQLLLVQAAEDTLSTSLSHDLREAAANLEAAVPK